MVNFELLMVGQRFTQCIVHSVKGQSVIKQVHLVKAKPTHNCLLKTADAGQGVN